MIGLDCAPPKLVFERYRARLPNLARLMDGGSFGPMRSSVPPITVPAWTCMTTGRDAGELGLYGFRDRREGGYGMRVVTSADVMLPRLWDRLSAAGKKCVTLFVPLTFPPSAGAGEMVSCFLTPSNESGWASPQGLKAELESLFGPYLMDVEAFRELDGDALLDALTTMAGQHFAIARHMWSTRAPDFMMMVEMGTDRLHHRLWREMDREDPRFTETSRTARCLDYYAMLDAEIGALLALVDEDTTVFVVSDHGARPLEGSVYINRWLEREGWLVLEEPASVRGPLKPEQVDWSRTRAWGEGGYYARVFLNVAGREPRGIIPPEAQASTRAALEAALRRGIDEGSRRVGAQVIEPGRDFRAARGYPPDLMVFFDDLAWRSAGSVGPGPVLAAESDLAPDGANHDWEGIWIMSGRDHPARGEVQATIYDLTPTVLGLFGLGGEPELLGRDWSRR